MAEGSGVQKHHFTCFSQCHRFFHGLSMTFVLQSKGEIEGQAKAMQRKEEELSSGLKARQTDLQNALQEVKVLRQQTLELQPQLAEAFKERDQLKQALKSSLASNQEVVHLQRILLIAPAARRRSLLASVLLCICMFTI